MIWRTVGWIWNESVLVAQIHNCTTWVHFFAANCQFSHYVYLHCHLFSLQNTFLQFPFKLYCHFLRFICLITYSPPLVCSVHPILSISRSGQTVNFHFTLYSKHLISILSILFFDSFFPLWILSSHSLLCPSNFVKKWSICQLFVAHIIYSSPSQKVVKPYVS